MNRGCSWRSGEDDHHGSPTELTFATKGELAVNLLRDAFSDGVRLDFVSGDEGYGACTTLRAFLEECGHAYVLRIRATFTLTLGGSTCLTREQTVTRHLKQKRKWTIRSAGNEFRASAPVPGPGSPPPARPTTF